MKVRFFNYEFIILEICGDGKNYGYYPCDDGNLDDGDGCSARCSIEKGFFCFGGTAKTADICFLRKSTTESPNVLAKKLKYSYTEFEVYFSQEVIIYGQLQEHMKISAIHNGRDIIKNYTITPKDSKNTDDKFNIHKAVVEFTEDVHEPIKVESHFSS